jgi:hypothetical protein
VVQILSTREMGTLTRTKKTAGVQAVVEWMAKDGAKIWKDLPYLVEDVTAYWLRDDITLASRENFAGFLAKLSAVGVD